MFPLHSDEFWPCMLDKEEEHSSCYETKLSTRVHWPCELLRLINEHSNIPDWESIEACLTSNPYEALLVDSQGMNALHAACYRSAPTSFIRTLLKYTPCAALQNRVGGELPLHLSCYLSNEEIQECIWRAYPQASRVQDSYGDCPLHYAVRHQISLSMVERILLSAPDAIGWKNAQGLTPFDEFGKSFCNAEKFSEILDEDDGYFRYDWCIMALFLRTSYFGPAVSYGSLLDASSCSEWIVHAAAGTPTCPPVILRCLCRLFPSQSRKRDMNGMTPLLLASKARPMPRSLAVREDDDTVSTTWSASNSEHQSSCCAEIDCVMMECEVDFEEEDAAFEAEDDWESPETSNAIAILLALDKGAAKLVDLDGYYPLEAAIRSGHYWDCISPLFSAHPSAVLSCEKPMFALVAEFAPDLDTVYNILRMDPSFFEVAKEVGKEEGI